MRLYDICLRLGIEIPSKLKNTDISRVTSRSEDACQGSLFVCLKGTRDDGHRYIAKAFENGAEAVVIEDRGYIGERTLCVEDTRAALSRMMDLICGEPADKMRITGVTGTNGKTSVSAMIKNILDTADMPCGVIGTLTGARVGDASLTTPDPEELYPMLAYLLKSGVRDVVMEASSHALKLKKLEPISFDVGIFTNLTEDHLDFHGDMEDYFKSKFELFKRCRVGIINIDDEYGKCIAALAPCDIMTYSLRDGADIAVRSLRYLGADGSIVDISSPWGELKIRCRAPGEISVQNALASVGAALELGARISDVEEAFESFRGVCGRLERVELPEGCSFSVFIDYAHTPDALLKALRTINKIKDDGSRTILVFGCGGDREREKRSVMGDIAVSCADLVIVTADNSRSESTSAIINDILRGVGEKKNFIVSPSRKRAIEYAIATAERGDVILLAGKGHERYEINRNGRYPFDEREIVKQAYKIYRSWESEE